MYYDNRGRTVQQSRKNPMGGWDRTNTGYSYTGLPLKSRTVHFAGRLIQDNRNNANALKTSYDYNLRSWTGLLAVGWNASNASYGTTFREELRYQNAVPLSQNPVQWSGNISSMDWTCGNDSVTRMYEFTYDGLSRLTNAVYGDSQNNSGTYSRAYTYDLHGNILSLTTPSGTVNVSYSGNRRAGSYTYDSNGNLTSDQDAGLTGMTYNALNLLSGYTHSADGYDTRITYTASGEKTDVSTEDNQIVASHWHRFGNLIYDNSFSYTRLLVDGGYVDISNAGYTYRFYIQDHQGNNRMVTDANGTVLQVNHYDPYGQLLAPISSTSAVSEYRYGGKEWSDVTLSYDFGARNYLPSIPRWTTMDPLAEKYYSISPYVYCAGNPVNLVDEEGKSTYVKRIFDGKFSVIGGNINDGDLSVYVGDYDEKGNFITDYSIGVTTTLYSFYNAEREDWVKDAIIDLSDSSGKDFLDYIAGANLSVLGYAIHAIPKGILDFKRTGGSFGVWFSSEKEVYRGMRVGTDRKGRTIISSARDIGNIVAGYISGSHGIPWWASRKAFDLLQSIQDKESSTESISSQSAQKLGWEMGIIRYNRKKYEINKK